MNYFDPTAFLSLFQNELLAARKQPLVKDSRANISGRWSLHYRAYTRR